MIVKTTLIQELLDNNGQWTLRVIKQEYSEGGEMYFVEEKNEPYDHGSMSMQFQSLAKAQAYFERRRASILMDNRFGHSD